MTIRELFHELITQRKNKYCLININSSSGIAYSLENPVKKWVKLEGQGDASLDSLFGLEQSVIEGVKSNDLKNQMVSLKELIETNARPFFCYLSLNIDGIDVDVTYLIVTNGEGGAEMRISFSVPN